MAIKAIIELQAQPGKRDELKAFIENLVATHGPGGPGFIGSTRYEVLDNPETAGINRHEGNLYTLQRYWNICTTKERLRNLFRVTIIKQLD
jgi:hypothetical protein